MAGKIHLSNLITIKPTYPRKCELCDVIYTNSNSFRHHRKRCLIVSAPENYPKLCKKCNEVFLSHKEFVHHKEHCIPKRKNTSIDSPSQKRHRTDNEAIDITDCGAAEGACNSGTKETHAHLSNFITLKPIYPRKCELCDVICNSSDSYSRHRARCLLVSAPENYLKLSKNCNETFLSHKQFAHHEEFCIPKQNYTSVHSPSQNRHQTDNGAINVADCGATEGAYNSDTEEIYSGATERTYNDATEMLENQKEVSEELKKISNQCQNIYEECKKSRENSEIMIDLLKENNALLKSISNDLNLIVQIKAVKNNVQMVHKNK